MDTNSPQNQPNQGGPKLDPSVLGFRSFAADIAKAQGAPFEVPQREAQPQVAPLPTPAPAPQKSWGSFFGARPAAADNQSHQTFIPPMPAMPTQKISSPPPPSNMPREIKDDIPIRQEMNLTEYLGHNPTDVVEKPDYTIHAETPTYETLEAANAFIDNKPPKEDPKKIVEALHNKNPLQTSRTIDSDIQVAAHDKNTTVEGIIIAEQQRARSSVKQVENPRLGIYILGLSGILVVAGLVALGTLYVYKITPQTPVPITTNPGTLITTESTQQLFLNGRSLQIALGDARNQLAGSRITSSLIKIDIFEGNATSTRVDGQRFATLLSSNIPSWLVRSFKPQYVAAFYNSTHGWQPVFVFKVTSFESGYAGMLKWEETMPTDLQTLVYVSQPSNASSTPTIATTSRATTQFINPIIQTGFHDIVLKNKDVRVLEDSSGHQLLFYSFPDKETLIITTDQSALEEINARLTTSQFVR